MEPHWHLAQGVITALRELEEIHELAGLMEAVANEIGCRFWALVHHDDLAVSRDGLVDLKNYPAAVVRRLVRDRHMRRDPVIRGCLFAGSAFVWSDLPSIIALDRVDEAALAFGARWGLNEGISVPDAVKANGRAVTVGHEQAHCQPVSLFQLVARGDSPGCDDVCTVSAQPAERRGSAVRARYRYLP
jgi:hypothetical protein